MENVMTRRTEIRILLCITISILLISCNKIRNTKDKAIEKLVDVLTSPVIKEYSLFDKFPEWKNSEYQIAEAEGIKCDNIALFYKYYFRYFGNRELIKQYISNIQCHYTEIVPDTALIKSTATYFEQETQSITKYESEKAKFFFGYKETDMKDLEFYTCTKTPEMHFIIFDLKKNLIYHMIKYFRE